MALGDNKRMTWGHGIAIVEGYAGGGFADYLNTTGETAERTGLTFPTLHLVEMIVLIEFVTLIRDETLIWQFDIALVCVLLVDGMNAESFFCQVASYCIVCRAIGLEKI